MSLEKFYKKYNQLKKELKQETMADSLRQKSPERRSSVEFVRSPSHPMGRMKPSMFDKQPVHVRSLEFEEKKTFALDKKVLTEDEAFWLDVPATPRTSSSSQPLPAHTSPHLSPISSSQQPRLILGSSQPKRKKNLKQQKIFGRNPFQRALSSTSSSSQPMEEMTSPISPLPQQQSQPILSQAMDDMIPDDEDDDMEIEVVTHEIDPFRMYDPSLFHWEDPSFSIGPGFFSSASPCYLVPMLNEPTRRHRVLKKLEKGTLGEISEENQCMEQDLDEDIRQFLSTHIEPNVKKKRKALFVTHTHLILIHFILF